MSQAIETQKTKLCVGAVTVTVPITFATTAVGLPTMKRAAGSFITDGVQVGCVISTNSTRGNKGLFLAKTVTATVVTIDAAADPNLNFATALVAGSSIATVLKSGLWVKEMVNFSGIDGEAADIDVTSLDSTAKEFKEGLADNGNFKADFNYVLADPGQTAMRAARRARALTAFQLRLSDNQFFEFSANVKSSPISGGVDNKVDTSFGMRISGAISDPTTGWVSGT